MQSINFAPDGAAGSSQTLPSWDLGDLYSAPDSPAVEADFARADADATAFEGRYKGHLANLTGADLATALAEYERIEERMGRLVSYAQLLFSSDSTSAVHGQFYQSVTERVTVISAHLLFLNLELNRIDDTVLEAKQSDPQLARWRPYLRDLRVFRPHQLSDEAERLLHDKEVTGRSAWSRLFDETIAGLRVPFRGDELTVSAALNKLSDRDRTVRQDVARAIGDVFSHQVRLFSLITNTLAKDKEIVDTWRRFPPAGDFPQPRQHGRGRGGGRAGFGRQRRLRAVEPSVLQPEGEMARAREAGALGPQRAAAGGYRPVNRLARRA